MQIDDHPEPHIHSQSLICAVSYKQLQNSPFFKSKEKEIPSLV